MNKDWHVLVIIKAGSSLKILSTFAFFEMLHDTFFKAHNLPCIWAITLQNILLSQQPSFYISDINETLWQ